MDNSFVFIVGSPRSGTTVLGEILDKHRDISQWYEPYFVWDRYFRNLPDDERVAEEATAKIVKQISSDFINYRKKTGSRIVVDKSPRNSLKISFIRKIFPEARFIHIIRDGRDVTLSIQKEWLRRRNIVQGGSNKRGFNYKKAFEVINDWLGRQKYIQYKIRALWFETRGHVFNRARHLNRIRWHGDVGWGPRFKEWPLYYKNNSVLQFNAYQWLRCVENISKSWPQVPIDKKMEIKYEDLVTRGDTIIKQVLEFLEVARDENFFSRIPKLKKGNFNKWKNEFSTEQVMEIQPILSPMLIRLGYEKSSNW